MARIGSSLRDAVRMATLTPATVIGADDRKGSLAPGKDADVTVIDGDANVQWTMARGQVVYNASRGDEG